MFTVNGNFIIYVSFFACSIKFTFAELVNCSNLQEKKSSKNTLVFDFITRRTHFTKFNDFFSWCKMKHVKDDMSAEFNVQFMIGHIFITFHL